MMVGVMGLMARVIPLIFVVWGGGGGQGLVSGILRGFEMFSTFCSGFRSIEVFILNIVYLYSFYFLLGVI